MHKLNAYKGMYVHLYTDDGTKILCRPLSIDQDNGSYYVVDIIETTGKYKEGRHKISEAEVSYAVELPREVQQGIEMTLKFNTNIKDIQHKLDNNDLRSKIEFGRKEDKD